MSKELIFVLDNVVPDWLYTSIKNNVSAIPVTYGHRGIGPDQGNSFFSRVWSTYELQLMPWECKAIFTALNHTRFNLSSDDEVLPLHLNQCQLNVTTQNLVGGIHTDVCDPAWTMVHLISGDSGMDFWTDLPENNGIKIQEVGYKDNRCIVFPSHILHRGLPPNKVEPRITFGYIFSGPPLNEYAAKNNVLSPIFKKEYKSYE